MLKKLAEKIFNLDSFDLYECFDVYGTIEAAKQGIQDSIQAAQDDVISWLSDIINNIDRGDNIGNDNADEIMEIIAGIKEYIGIDD